MLDQKTVHEFFNSAAHDILKLSESEQEFIKKPHATLKIHVPFMRDDGSYSTVVAYRCHHNLHELPLKGGFTITPKVTQNTVQEAALLKSIQLAFLQIPFGGSKGGIKINLENYSEGEIETIIKRMAIEMVKYKFIGPEIDVAGPEQGSTRIHMDYIKDIYQTVYGHTNIHSSAIVTGKSNINGGLKNFDQGAGSGIYYSLKTMIENKNFADIRKKLNLDSKLENQTVIMSGFGNMGKAAALFLYEKGVKIIGIQEYDGCVYNRTGINIPEFLEHYEKYNSMQDYVDYIEEQEIIDRQCDFLILAAYADYINQENVDLVNAKVIIECSNQGISYKADEILNKKGVFIIPDMLGNSGRVISAYREWLKNIQHKSIGRLTMKWEEKSKFALLSALQKKLNEKGIMADFTKIDVKKLRGGGDSDLLKSTVAGIVDEAMVEAKDFMDKNNCSFRLACMSLGIQRINRKNKQANIS